MIKYQLICDQTHEFEGWFKDSRDYDQQADAHLISCPYCSSSTVRKAIMAPALARSGAIQISSSAAEKIAEIYTNLGKAAEKARNHIEKNFDYVGERFPEEARRIHYGETSKRDIYGEATKGEVKDLVDEGVTVLAVPSNSSQNVSPNKKKLN